VILLGLMLTGMPISISLGLTVLSFLFMLTQVPLESVALKLFTGIEKFEIMAIPFFILAGNFLTHGGVAKRMIRFATSMVGHWYGGLGLSGVLACACSPRFPVLRRRPWWRSARSCCRRWSRRVSRTSSAPA
jgi:C4-dicarboxylate transporter DctM subunit